MVWEEDNFKVLENDSCLTLWFLPKDSGSLKYMLGPQK